MGGDLIPAHIFKLPNMTHGSLFSGIGGFDLAAEWMGWQNVFHCEWMPFPRQILHHYWPNAISYEDITKTDFTIHKGAIDIITGGFPCQPYSSAGKRLGKDDQRHLWPEMLRAIHEIEPTYIVGENVYGLTNWGGGMVFNEVCVDLENCGYQVQPVLLPACAVGAPHRRDRIWFVAYSGNNRNRTNGGAIQAKAKKENGGRQEHCAASGQQIQLPVEPSVVFGDVSNSQYIRSQKWSETRNIRCEEIETFKKRGKSSISIETNSSGYFLRKEWENFPSQSPICGGDDGIPTKLDNITISKWRNESIKGYGNAIVPQVAYQIFKTIQKLENEKL